VRGPLLTLGAPVVVSAVVDTAHYWLLERTSERVVLGARRTLVHRLLRLQMHAVADRVEVDRPVAVVEPQAVAPSPISGYGRSSSRTSACVSSARMWTGSGIGTSRGHRGYGS